MISKFSQTFDPNGKACNTHVEPVHTFIPDAVLMFADKSNPWSFPSSSHLVDYFPPPMFFTHSLPKTNVLLLSGCFNFSFTFSVPKRKKLFSHQKCFYNENQ